MRRKRKNIRAKLLLATLVCLVCASFSFAQSVQIIPPISPIPGKPNEFCQNALITLSVDTDHTIEDIQSYSWLISEAGKEGPFNDTIMTEDPSFILFTYEPGSKWCTVEVIYGKHDLYTARSDTIEIIINALPTSTISGNDEICLGDSAELAIRFSGAVPLHFFINHSAEYTSSGDNYDVRVSPSNNTEYEVTRVEDANGCLAPDSLMKGEAVITMLDLPTFSISAEDKICDGSSDSIFINLTGIGPWILEYETVKDQEIDLSVHTADTVLVVAPDHNTTYDFTLLEDGNGCIPSDPEKSKSLTIEVQNPPYAGTGAWVEICAGDTAIVLKDDTIDISEGELAKNLFSFLQGIPDSGGYWDPPTINLNLAKTYTYLVDAIDPCIEDASAQVKITEQPKKDALAIVGKPHDNPVLLIYPENELEYRWYRVGEEEVLDTIQYYLFDSPGNYYVKVNIPGSYCITESDMFTVTPQSDTAVAKSDAVAFNFFPNPADDHLTLILKEKPVPDTDRLNLKIISIEGSCVFEQSISNVMEDINIQRLLPGIYTIFIVGDDKIFGTQKLLITR